MRMTQNLISIDNLIPGAMEPKPPETIAPVQEGELYEQAVELAVIEAPPQPKKRPGRPRKTDG